MRIRADGAEAGARERRGVAAEIEDELARPAFQSPAVNWLEVTIHWPSGLKLPVLTAKKCPTRAPWCSTRPLRVLQTSPV